MKKGAVVNNTSRFKGIYLALYQIIGSKMSLCVCLMSNYAR